MLFAKAADAAQAAFQAAETEIRDSAEILHGEGRFRQRAYLIASGIPFDAAMSMSDAELIAWTVSFGEADGGEWDWEAGAWKAPQAKIRSLRPREG